MIVMSLALPRTRKRSGSFDGGDLDVPGVVISISLVKVSVEAGSTMQVEAARGSSASRIAAPPSHLFSYIS